MVVSLLLLSGSWRFRLVLERIVGLDLEGGMLKHFQSVAGKLDEVVTLEKLFAFSQVRVRIVLHYARFAVVVGRVRVQIPQVLGGVFSLSQVADICPDFVVLVHELRIERLCILLVHLVRIFTLAARVKRRRRRA